MALADHPTQVHGGAGVVAHLSGAIVVALPDSAEHRVTTKRVIDVAREATAGGGVSVVRRLAGVLGETDPQDTPPLAVVADAGDSGDVAVLLHGAADLIVHQAGSTERLSGATVPTWVDRVFPTGWDRIEVVPAGTDAPPFDPLVDLREGTVGGSGVTIVANATAPPVAPDAQAAEPARADDTLLPASAPEPLPPPTQEAAAPPRDFVSVAFDDPAPEADERPPLPVATADVDPVAAADADAMPTVLGVHCSRGHFNDPNVLYCSICGISTAQQTKNLVEGPRPALGVLVLDDGTTFLVDADYVIGREPDHAPEVAAGDARPLPLADTQRTLSRVHARLTLDGWQVLVADAGSANGTYIADGSAQQWTRVGADQPVPITPGTHLLVGHRTFIFETHRGSG
jgi:hypothetical protein